MKIERDERKFDFHGIGLAIMSRLVEKVQKQRLNGVIIISAYHIRAGDFFTPDIKIDIDRDMQSMMIVLNNETIIKSEDYYVPAKIWKQYKG